MVLERLPRGHVIAVDASPSMCEHARERLPADRDDRDLLRPARARAARTGRRDRLDRDLPLDPRPRRPVRAHARRCCGRAASSSRSAAAPATSPPCARLGDELGPPFAEHLARMPPTWNYADAARHARAARARRLRRRRLLARAGAGDPAAAARVPRDRRSSGCTPRTCREELRDPFLDAIIERLDDPPVLDYVRLNWDARAR